jgi:cytochrome c oxidase subunit 3
MTKDKTYSASQPASTLAMHPKKFALWLFIVSIVMLFAALTSAYIVKQSDGNWLTIHMPSAFIYSTIIILLSSGSMHYALISAKKDNLSRITWSLTVTLVLGITFLIVQYFSWSQLIQQNVYFVSNYASGSFIYVFTGLHGVHLISGIIYLIIAQVTSVRKKIHSKNMTMIEMCATYWHFLGGLWVYLYIFLLLNS